MASSFLGALCHYFGPNLGNYDLPWNPNRLEQRFGRIHRIGQDEVCHLWNLVASETREGEVFHTLLKKLEEEREALGGQVFDVLGKVLFDNRPLRDLIVEAIRYGDRPDVRAKLTQVVDKALDRQHLSALLEERALAHEVMDVVRVRQIREDLERAAARRLQPHFIASFFLESLKRLGGKYYEREPRRYEITYVPPAIRSRNRPTDTRATILQRYERIVFEKDLVSIPGKPLATFVCPGHPLLDATIDLVLAQNRDLLKQGTILVDPNDVGEEIRILFYLEHTIQDARTGNTGERHEVSRQLQFIEIDASGNAHSAGYAPFLNYRPLTDQEHILLPTLRNLTLLKEDLESQALSYAVTKLVPHHLAEVKKRCEEQITKTMAAVNDRLTKEISYWDRRAEELKAQEAAGRVNARLNSEKARQRALELYARLEHRMHELEQQRHLSPLPPIVVGGVLVIPAGLLSRLQGEQPTTSTTPDQFAQETARIEHLAMQAILEIEHRLGFIPHDVSADKCGYDIESRIPGTGKLRFIEVKGRIKDSETVTVTKNEILTALNKPEDFILAIVLVDREQTTAYYVTKPFHREPDFGVTSVNYKLSELLNKGVIPV